MMGPLHNLSNIYILYKLWQYFLKFALLNVSSSFFLTTLFPSIFLTDFLCWEIKSVSVRISWVFPVRYSRVFPCIFPEYEFLFRQIFPGMAADVTGKLHVGDAILSVDAQVAHNFDIQDNDDQIMLIINYYHRYPPCRWRYP